MSFIRVTDGSSSYQSLRGLQSSNARLSALQAKMSSGNQITKPSDDPAGTVRALQLRGALKRNTQFTANANDALGWMSTADAAYNQINSMTQDARTLVVKGMNAGASTGQSATAIANEIDAIRSSLLTQANTTYNGRPVFGGTTSGSGAYDTAGNYVGDAGTVSRTVGPQATVQINQNGPQVFGPAGSDLFTTLSNISTALRTTGTVPPAQLAVMDTAIQRINDSRAAEGAAYDRVQKTQDAQATTGLDLTTQLSNIQDIDLAATAVQVSTANVTYQAALQTTAGIRQMSLLNFLR